MKGVVARTTIFIECRNNCTTPRVYQVVLTIKGAVENEKTATIDPDKTTHVGFEVGAGVAEEYYIEVYCLTGSLTFKEAPVPVFANASLFLEMMTVVFIRALPSHLKTFLHTPIEVTRAG